MLNVPVSNFSVMSGRSHHFIGITSTFMGSKCVFAQGQKIRKTLKSPVYTQRSSNFCTRYCFYYAASLMYLKCMLRTDCPFEADVLFLHRSPYDRIFPVSSYEYNEAALHIYFIYKVLINLHDKSENNTNIDIRSL